MLRAAYALVLFAASASAFAPSGFTPALRTSSGFNGASLATPSARKATVGPVMAEAWVRVCPANDVAAGRQFDAVVAGTPVLTGRFASGGVWAISAKNSATGTEMYGGSVDEAAQTIRDPQWGTQYSLNNGDVVGKWCPSPPVLGALIGTLFPPTPVWVPKVRESGGYIEVLLDVDAKAEFEKKYWKGILDAQGKADGGYY
mmetsp:Transcript_47456/g.74155  ORF Transcript_47456/g.74155 Transcript_47456/m.74155 type:complete len:201 (-) Transcript_47456:680-1282(-)